jgi:hypothetical protein
VDLDAYRRVIADDYLAALTSLPMADVRARRAECQSLEDEVSMHRRVVQGRLDVVRSEVDRRRSGELASDASQLLGGLPDALAGESAVSGGSVRDEFVDLGELDTDDSLANLPDLSDSGLDDALARLQEAEAVLSLRRRRLFDRIDALADELTRRYRTGEASVDTLLG